MNTNTIETTVDSATTTTETDTNVACESTPTTEAPKTLDAIEEALASVQATRAANAVTEAAKESKRPRLTDEEKAQREVDREAERNAKKAAKAEKKASKEETTALVKAEKKAAREAKKAAKEAAPKKIPHLAKIEKAANLPALSDELSDLVDEIIEQDAPTMSAVMAHLAYQFKIKQTIASNEMKREVGETVQITSGNADVLGLVGVVSEVHRIRAFVTVAGIDKPIYTYLADLESVSVEDTVSEEVSAEAC